MADNVQSGNSTAVQAQAALDEVSQKIESLAKRFNMVTTEEKVQYSVTPYFVVAAVVIPMLIGCLLYFIKPNIVTDVDGEERSVSKSKMFKWSLLFTVIGEILLYIGYRVYLNGMGMQ